MANLFNLNIKGLKCDTPGCTYRDETIEAKDYEQYINTKCPYCGGILLTKADYKLVKKLERRVNITNNIFRFFGGDKLPLTNGNDKVTFDFDGSGEIKVQSIQLANKRIDIKR